MPFLSNSSCTSLVDQCPPLPALLFSPALGYVMGGNSNGTIAKNRFQLSFLDCLPQSRKKCLETILSQGQESFFDGDTTYTTSVLYSAPCEVALLPPCHCLSLFQYRILFPRRRFLSLSSSAVCLPGPLISRHATSVHPAAPLLKSGSWWTIFLLQRHAFV